MILARVVELGARPSRHSRGLLVLTSKRRRSLPRKEISSASHSASAAAERKDRRSQRGLLGHQHANAVYELLVRGRVVGALAETIGGVRARRLWQIGAAISILAALSIAALIGEATRGAAWAIRSPTWCGGSTCWWSSSSSSRCSWRSRSAESRRAPRSGFRTTPELGHQGAFRGVVRVEPRLWQDLCSSEAVDVDQMTQEAR